MSEALAVLYQCDHIKFILTSYDQSLGWHLSS